MSTREPAERIVRVDVASLAPGEKRAIEEGELSLLVCNVDGEFHVVENVCSHARVPLTDARLDGCELECEFHGAVFDVRDGRALALPARRPLRSFPSTRAGRELLVRV